MSILVKLKLIDPQNRIVISHNLKLAMKFKSTKIIISYNFAVITYGRLFLTIFLKNMIIFLTPFGWNKLWRLWPYGPNDIAFPTVTSAANSTINVVTPFILNRCCRWYLDVCSWCRQLKMENTHVYLIYFIFNPTSVLVNTIFPNID